MSLVRLAAFFAAALFCAPALANSTSQEHDGEIGSGARAFNQLGQALPTPNVYRTASGAPGPQYWQQRADYKIDVALDEKNRRIEAREAITYTNNSPDTLRYLWVQLDQNRFRNDSLARRSETAETAGTRRAETGDGDFISYNTLRRTQAFNSRDHGFEITEVKNGAGQDLKATVVDTMMRIDLPAPLRPGAKTSISIGWTFNIIDEAAMGGRGGYERFDNDTYIYFLAQWFPRMAAYTDYEGWAHKAFLGRGEFTLEFGDYEVAITAPEDHIVASTGVLTNPAEVLTAEQRKRLTEARTKDRPSFIVTPEEALENEKDKATGTKTWKFKAENVRDFAWSSSRKFIWDAMGFKQDDKANPNVLVMSFYPSEAEPIWSKYSSHAVAHTMDVYSRFSFPYPYPTAQSVNTWERGGMEYPMMTFNGYRPTKKDKVDERTYARRIKYGLIGVIIHEIGHIYFPMTVNTDERQWTWMDEGINTFLEYVAEIEWEEEFPAFRGKTNILDYITEYMTSEAQVPIMTQSDSILQFGPNAYTKPAAALTILRETVMGRELFDFAFREYAQRWKFKRPTPADFFRTLEDASGVDLDWFWRGWFYTTDHVDIAINDVREYKIATSDPEKDFPENRKETAANEPEPLIQARNRAEGKKTYLSRYPELADFYNENDPFTVSNADKNVYWVMRNAPVEEGGLEEWEKKALDQAIADDDFIYFMDFENIGGLVMPIPLKLTYADGSTAETIVPAEIWRRNAHRVTRLMISEKQITAVAIDENHEIADADRQNNHYPRTIKASRLQAFKAEDETRDLMKDMMAKLKAEEAKDQPEGDGTRVPLRPADDADGEPDKKD
ncbi:MAG: M1 family metallopeptidase [Pseudomonadota bacterium]